MFKVMEFRPFLYEYMERSDILTLAQTDYNRFTPKKVRFGMTLWSAKIH